MGNVLKKFYKMPNFIQNYTIVVLKFINNSMYYIIGRIFGVKVSAFYMANKVKLHKNDAKSINVLCLYRDRFGKDIDQLKLKTKSNWHTISNSSLGKVQKAWIPREIAVQTIFASTKNPLYYKAKMKTAEFSRHFLNYVKSKYGIDAVMTANFDYWQDDGIRRVCHDIGVPYIVLSRENVILEKSIGYYIKLYKNEYNYKFQGDAVAVFNSKTKDALVKSEVCNPEQVFITGAPRLDPWLDNNSSVIIKDHIVLLSYADGYDAPKNFREVLLKLLDLSQKLKTVKFAVKCKTRDDLKIVSGLLKYNRINKPLELHVNTPLYELLPKARVIIGHNSLSVIEGLFTDAVIIIPYWDDAKQDLFIDHLPEEKKAVFKVANDVREFNSLVINYANNYKPLSDAEREKRLNIISDYFYLPDDGKYNSTLVEDLVKNIVTNK